MSLLGLAQSVEGILRGLEMAQQFRQAQLQQTAAQEKAARAERSEEQRERRLQLLEEKFMSGQAGEKEKRDLEERQFGLKKRQQDFKEKTTEEKLELQRLKTAQSAGKKSIAEQEKLLNKRRLLEKDLDGLDRKIEREMEFKEPNMAKIASWKKQKIRVVQRLISIKKKLKKSPVKERVEAKRQPEQPAMTPTPIATPAEAEQATLRNELASRKDRIKERAK